MPNTSGIFFYLCAKTGPQRDSTFSKGPSDVLDHATSEMASGSKLGLDATKKLPGEGFKRTWPPLIKMDAEVKAGAHAIFGICRQECVPTPFSVVKDAIFSAQPRRECARDTEEVSRFSSAELSSTVSAGAHWAHREMCADFTPVSGTDKTRKGLAIRNQIGRRSAIPWIPPPLKFRAARQPEPALRGGLLRRKSDASETNF